MAISLKSLNVEAACDTPYDLDIVDEQTGKSTGITLKVIGAHSQVITKLVAKAVNAKRQAESQLAKKGKDVPVTKVEDDLEFGIELAAKRIVGWSGIEESFTPDLAFELCKTNPVIRDQVVAASEDMSHYTK